MPRAPKFTPVAATSLAPAPPNLFAGTSGWAYATWKPGFYPAATPGRGFLHFYAAKLTSVEVNFTFRKLCEQAQLEEWMAATPPGFRFTFKAPQRISHFRRLRECEEHVAEFVASLAPVRAANKLGALLFQLPPNFKADPVRLAAFLAMPALADPVLQLAFEFRHASWFTEEVYAILRKHHVALCVAESADLVTPDIQSAPHLYYRLRCPGGYTLRQVNVFAKKFAALATQHEVFVYFKHEDEPTGALNATAFLKAANAAAKKQGLA